MGLVMTVSRQRTEEKLSVQYLLISELWWVRGGPSNTQHPGDHFKVESEKKRELYCYLISTEEFITEAEAGQHWPFVFSPRPLQFLHLKPVFCQERGFHLCRRQDENYKSSHWFLSCPANRRIYIWLRGDKHHATTTTTTTTTITTTSYGPSKSLAQAPPTYQLSNSQLPPTTKPNSQCGG